MCLNSELKDIYRDFDAEHTNYLPMEKFLDYIEGLSSVWKSTVIWGGENNDEKQTVTAMDKMEDLRRQADAIGGQAV